jgi:hypothetical protein
MGIFGSTTRQILEYTIYLTDEAQVAALQAADGADLAPGGGGTYGFDVAQVQAPLAAAVEFNAPIYDPLNKFPSIPTAYHTTTPPFTAPGITSSWFTSDKNFPLDEAGFKRKSGGWFGISSLFGDTVYYYWRRTFVYQPGEGTSGAGSGSGDGFVAGPPPAPTPISNRRWIDGFELPVEGEGGTGAATNIYMRGSSRHVDGIGFALREPSTTSVNHLHTPLVPAGAGVTASWERFYVRVRKLPTASTDLWRSGSTPSGNQGMLLRIGAAGELTVSSTDAAAAVTLHGVAGVLTLNTWARVDILLRQSSFVAVGPWAVGAGFDVYLNGVLKFSISPPGLGGTGHTDSRIGRTLSAANGIEYDVDDWINAELPTFTGVLPACVITDPSWFVGSRVHLIRPKGIISAGAWSQPVEGWRIQRQQFPDQPSPMVQTSNTPLDTIVYGTDAEHIDAMPGQVGAFVLCINSKSNGNTNGKMGYKLATGAIVMLTNDLTAGLQVWRQGLYNSGVANPPSLTGLQLYIEHSNTAQIEDESGFFAVCEVLGHWGDEDPRAPGSTSAPIQPIVKTSMNGVHNAPYPYTAWATQQIMAPAAVMIKGGTYVGTGAPMDLTFPQPIHWLWIRPLTGAPLNGGRWWSSCLGPHEALNNGPTSSLMPHIEIDPDFAGAGAVDQQEIQAIARFAANAQTNAAGITYQYIAFSDAAMRFCLNGAFAHLLSAAGPFDNTLFVPQFQPEAGFFWQEDPETTAVVAQLWYKGVGHAVSAASKLETDESAEFGDFGLGVFRSRVSAHNAAGTAVAYNLWRRDDRSQDPGIPRVLQLVSYVGDGAGARTINLTPASGRRPMFGLVTPHNATVALFRDPSHTGTTSSEITNATNAATGITGGGIDQIMVNTALNAAGVTYDVFVLPGTEAACNNGWGCNSTEYPVEPGTGGTPPGPSPDFPPGCEDFEGDNPCIGEPGTVDSDLDTDVEALCLPYTHRRINRALSKLGITVQVTSITTELTEEAALGRLHYKADVAATQRDFPWAFTTRYATLVLVAGTPTVPVNGDWTYAYRVPANMIFARRIVAPGMARQHDPNPPPFRQGQDDTSTIGADADLIYTDQADAVLEYTWRTPCAGGAGDALFNDCLEWRLAHSFAPGLTKDSKKQAYCWAMYINTLNRATVANANEAEPQNRGGDADWIAGRN